MILNNQINMSPLLKKIRIPFQYTFFNCTIWIIAINIFIYFLISVIPEFRHYLSLNVIFFVEYKMIWQPFTYMFVHGNIQHLFFNMLGLLFFGIAVEKAVGSKEFLLMYLVTGFLCGMLSFAVYYYFKMYRVFLMGASGAVYAMLLAYAVIFPRSKIFIWGIIPIPAPVLVVAYAVIELLSQLFGANSGIAHLTHLGGFVFAWFYFVLRMGINPYKIWKSNYR